MNTILKDVTIISRKKTIYIIWGIIPMTKSDTPLPTIYNQRITQSSIINTEPAIVLNTTRNVYLYLAICDYLRFYNS